MHIVFNDAGWSSPVARRAHNPKAAGSNPAPATNLFNFIIFAVMAELADALDSGSSGVTTVEVRVLLTAPLAEVAQR